MGTASLGRKATPPTVPPKHVPRPRLVAALDRAVELPLTLIAAGPGWGKTVLLSEWANHRSDPVVWMSLDPSDDHEEAFWSLFCAALGHGVPTADLRQSADPLKSSGEMAVDVLGRILDDLPGPLVLVLDNFHFISSKEVLGTISSLILNPLAGLRIVMAVRSDPLLPIHRVRIAGQMAELRAGDVAMNSTEIAHLLKAHGVELAAHEQATLAARTEGWAAGLKLSVLRMEGRARPGEFVTEFALDQGSIGEYLTLEVLATQTAATRHLLIRTSIAGEVCGSLADAITGGTDGAEVLRHLAETNSFVTTDRENLWYRCHPLLQEVLKNLRANDSPEMQVQLHRRAARWYDDHGRLLEGVRHALIAGDWSHSMELLAQGAFEAAFLRHGRQPLKDIVRLLDPALPDPDSVAEFRSSAIRAAIAACTGKIDRGRSMVDELHTVATASAEQDWSNDPTGSAFLGFSELVLAYHAGDLDSAERASTLINNIPERPVLVAAAKGIIGAARYWSGDFGAAETALRASVEAALTCDAPAVAVGSLGMLAMLTATQGRSDAARQSAEQGVTILRASPGVRGGAAAALHLGAAHLALLSGDLDAYQGSMRRTAIELESSLDRLLGYTADLLAAKALAMAGQYGPAQDLLTNQSLSTMSQAFNLPEIRQVLLSEVAVAMGRPATAIKSLSAMEANVPHLTDLARARADLALGEYDHADVRIRRVVSSSTPAARMPVLLDAVLLGAMVAECRGDEAAAAEAVSRAIDLGTAEGLVMPFIEAGPRLGKLLRRHAVLAARWPGPPPDALSDTAPEAADRSRLVRQRTVGVDGHREIFEHLTERELSVLRWLTTTMTTAEIADELFVSINTVKTHIAAVYRKLGAARRREAIDRARELQLI